MQNHWNLLHDRGWSNSLAWQSQLQKPVHVPSMQNVIFTFSPNTFLTAFHWASIYAEKSRLTTYGVHDRTLLALKLPILAIGLQWSLTRWETSQRYGPTIPIIYVVNVAGFASSVRRTNGIELLVLPVGRIKGWRRSHTKSIDASSSRCTNKKMRCPARGCVANI